MGMYCPNCGCLTLHKECEFCGPEEHYKDDPKFCGDCGGVKQSKEEESE